MASLQRRRPQNTAETPEDNKKTPPAKSRIIGIAAFCIALLAVVCLIAAAVGKKQPAGQEPGSTQTPSIPTALSDADFSAQTSHQQENPAITDSPSFYQRPEEETDRNPPEPENSARPEPPESSDSQTTSAVAQTDAATQFPESEPSSSVTEPETTAPAAVSPLVFSVLSDDQAAEKVSGLSMEFDSTDLTGCELVFSDSFYQRVLSPEGDVINARVYCFTADMETPERFFSEFCLSHTYSGDSYMVFLTKEQAVRLQSASFSESGIFVFLAS